MDLTDMNNVRVSNSVDLRDEELTFPCVQIDVQDLLVVNDRHQNEETDIETDVISCCISHTHFE